MKRIFTLAIAATITMSTVKTVAQSVALNTTGAKADTSAILDVSSVTKGLLAPRMTTAQKNAIVTPATGLLVYQTDGTPGFYYYTGSAWITLQGATGATGATGLTGAQGVQGATGPAGVGVPTGGTAGQVLSKVDGTNYNTQWTTASGGGTYTTLTGQGTANATFNTLNTIGTFTMTTKGIATVVLATDVSGNTTSRMIAITDNSDNVLSTGYSGGTALSLLSGKATTTAVLNAGTYKVKYVTTSSASSGTFNVYKIEF